MAEEECQRQRPGTAPVQRSPSDASWLEVDDLVKQMLGSVATAATSSVSALGQQLRRPHTACAGARAVATVVLESPHEDDDDDESDGGSLDPDDGDDGDDLPAPRPCTGLKSQRSTGDTDNLLAPERPQTAPDGSEGQMRLADGAALQRAEVLSLQRLSKDEQLLLSGRLWGRSSPSSPSVQASEQKAASSSGYRSAPSRQSTQNLPTAMAEKLPRRCLLLDAKPAADGKCSRRQNVSGLAMAPRASRFKSHSSWTNFLPMRKPVKDPGSALLPPDSSAAQGYPSSAQGKALEAAKVPLAAAAGVPAEDSAACEVAPASKVAGAPAADETGKKRSGPKYRVVPGASRPAGARTGTSADFDKVKQEFMVLEFRTEPRVVPASRRNLGCEDSVSAAALSAVRSKSQKAPAILGGKKNGNFAPVPRFRPDSGSWALEREALAARA